MQTSPYALAIVSDLFDDDLDAEMLDAWEAEGAFATLSQADPDDAGATLAIEATPRPC